MKKEFKHDEQVPQQKQMPTDIDTMMFTTEEDEDLN